jgi:hypothetical protein
MDKKHSELRRELGIAPAGASMDAEERKRVVAQWNSLADEPGAPKDEDIKVKHAVARRIGEVDVSLSNIFSRQNNTARKKIQDSRSAYENIGVIGNIIDIMTDFAIEGLSIDHESEAAERFYKRWSAKVNLNSIVEETLRALFRDSNVPVMTYKAKIMPTEISRLKRVMAARDKLYGQGIFAPEPVGGRDVRIPYQFTLLDVTKLNLENTTLFGKSTYTYQFDKKRVDETFKATDEETVALREALREGVNSAQWNTFKKTGKYPLDNEKLTLMFYKKDGYKDWANPMLHRVMDDLKFKRVLRNMDISIAESIQNSVQIIKLGDTPGGLPPSRARLDKMANMLLNPSKSKTIVWDDLVSIESDYPDTGSILGSDKYKAVETDILAGLGISEVLVGGPGGNYSNSFLSVRTLMERLETGRNIVLLNFLLPIVTDIARAIGLRKPPFIRFKHMSLRDENAEKKLLLELVDRNVLSYRTLLEYFGHDINVEIKRMKREDKMRERLEETHPHTLQKVGKFGPHAESSGDQNAEDSAQQPTAQEQQGEQGGRPEQINEEPEQQGTERDTKPQGIANELIKTVQKAYTLIKKHEMQRIARANGITVRELKKSQRLMAEEVAFDILARFKDINVINEKTINDAVYKRTKAPAILDRCVKQVFKSLVKRFRKRFNREPKAKERDKLRSSAWAICRSRLDT